MTRKRALFSLVFIAVLFCLFIPGSVFAQGVCTINNIRLGGEPGDMYIGPTDNGDGTYRTCYYVEGSNFPGSNAGYMLALNGVSTAIVADFVDGADVVICATGLSYTEGPIDVFIELEPGCNSTAQDLYDTFPICEQIGPQGFCSRVIPTMDGIGPALLILLLLSMGFYSLRRQLRPRRES